MIKVSQEGGLDFLSRATFKSKHVLRKSRFLGGNQSKTSCLVTPSFISSPILNYMSVQTVDFIPFTQTNEVKRRHNPFTYAAISNCTSSHHWVTYTLI